MSPTIRPELAALPSTMRDLPLDARGYPVPWFVDWIDGVPEFRAMDQRKFRLAITEKRCWVCGGSFRGRLGFLDTFAFVIGPMCAVNRVSSEPPSHLICAEWSAKNCPFLSRPKAKRREDDVINTAACAASAAGIMIARNPGVTLVWPTTRYTTFPDGKGRTLIEIGPLSQPAQWWAEGRPATRAEVQASIDTGLPFLEAACDQEETPERQAFARHELGQKVTSAMRLLPAEGGR